MSQTMKAVEITQTRRAGGVADLAERPMPSAFGGWARL